MLLQTTIYYVYAVKRCVKFHGRRGEKLAARKSHSPKEKQLGDAAFGEIELKA